MMSCNKLIAIIILLTALASCINTAMTGANLAYNRSTLQNNASRHYIAMQIDKMLGEKYPTHYAMTNIKVVQYNYLVILLGQLPSVEIRRDVVEVAKQYTRTGNVYNAISIDEPISARQAARDTWITSKVKLQIARVSELDPRAIKVVTENNVVYLIGNVTPNQKEFATEVARKVNGVAKVITFFQIIDYDPKVT